MDKQSSGGRRGLRRALGIAGAVALCGSGAVVGVAVAAPGASTTDVAFIRLTPAHKVLSNASVASLGSKSVVVVGGSTTVPTNATTVQLAISVKGAKAGDLDVWPTGNENGGTNFHLGYAGGNQIVSATFGQHPGMSNEVTFGNTSPSAMTITATIVGYSSQVTAGDVSPAGGQVGDVLSNTGSGAVWAPPTGGRSFASKDINGTTFPAGTEEVLDVNHVTVPAGTYYVSATASYIVQNTGIGCWIRSPAFDYSAESEAYGTNYEVGSLATQALIQTTGGDITLVCEDSTSPTLAQIADDTIIATQLGAASGDVVPAHRSVKYAMHKSGGMP